MLAILRFLGAVLFSLIVPVLAFASCDPSGIRTDARPQSDGPTEVSISAYLMDFLGVDDLNQSIELDVRVEMSWRDERLVAFEDCRFLVGEVWFPDVMIVNSSDLRAKRTRGRNQVRVEADGRVTYVQRFSGAVSSYHELRRFPFDQQDFTIAIGVVDMPATAIRLTPDSESSGMALRFNIEGWRIGEFILSEEIESSPLIRDDVSLLTLTITAERNPTYYIFRILLPLLFVVAMSWAIFWVPPERFEFQIGLGATSMLTTIAFTLSIAGKLPDLGYLTALDKMLIWAVFLVFLTMVEALVTGRLVINEREHLALAIDRVARFFVPALLLLGWGVIVWSSG